MIISIFIDLSIKTENLFSQRICSYVRSATYWVFRRGDIKDFVVTWTKLKLLLRNNIAFSINSIITDINKFLIVFIIYFIPWSVILKFIVLNCGLRFWTRLIFCIWLFYFRSVLLGIHLAVNALLLPSMLYYYSTITCRNQWLLGRR